MTAPQRLDVALVARGLARSRGHARDLITTGAVTVDGQTAVKGSAPVSADTRLVVAEGSSWVGRAAGKLDGALNRFDLAAMAIQGASCLDVGASTGGFTQVLLARGAARVVALDVGHGQLVESLRHDARVVDASGTNIREVHPGTMGDPFDVVVADVSFISLALVLPVIAELVRPGGHVIVLVKPQFEVGRARLGKNGVVSEPAHRADAVQSVVGVAGECGLVPCGLLPSAIVGETGNQEFLLWSTKPTDKVDIDLMDCRVQAEAGRITVGEAIASIARADGKG